MDGITYPFERLTSVVIFQSIINDGVYLDEWNKSNIVPCHKKEIKIWSKAIDQLAFFRFLVERLPITFFKFIL